MHNIRNLENDFIILNDIFGTCINYSRVKPDCLLFPKTKIIELGFPATVIPVKLSPSCSYSDYISAYKYCYKYNHSSFKVRGKTYKPMFSVVHALNLSERNETAIGVKMTMAYHNVLNTEIINKDHYKFFSGLATFAYKYHDEFKMHYNYKSLLGRLDFGKFEDDQDLSGESETLLSLWSKSHGKN